MRYFEVEKSRIFSQRDKKLIRYGGVGEGENNSTARYTMRYCAEGLFRLVFTVFHR